MSIDTTAQSLMEAMQGKPQPSAYDSQATVTRVDGDTLWVHIPGGVDETPIQRTIDASEGDIVQVRVSNGSAFAMGNASAPPTDDTRANEAYTEANNALTAAATAEQAASEKMITTVRNPAIIREYFCIFLHPQIGIRHYIYLLKPAGKRLIKL